MHGTDQDFDEADLDETPVEEVETVELEQVEPDELEPEKKDGEDLPSTDLITSNGRVPVVAGTEIQSLVPKTLDEAWRMAQALAAAGEMVPDKLQGNPEKIMACIMVGLEVGLPPMNALQNIAIINGKPTMWGDAIIGLVRASGLCEYVQESIEGDGTDVVAICRTKRKGEPEEVERRFSFDDAQKAGLLTKKGAIWKQYLNRMLQMRARSFCLRDTYADVLKGLHVREEVETYAKPEPEEVDSEKLLEDAGKDEAA